MNLVPEKRMDKNGKLVTRHVSIDQSGNITHHGPKSKAIGPPVLPQQNKTVSSSIKPDNKGNCIPTAEDFENFQAFSGELMSIAEMAKENEEGHRFQDVEHYAMDMFLKMDGNGIRTLIGQCIPEGSSGIRRYEDEYEDELDSAQRPARVIHAIEELRKKGIIDKFTNYGSDLRMTAVVDLMQNAPVLLCDEETADIEYGDYDWDAIERNEDEKNILKLVWEKPELALSVASVINDRDTLDYALILEVLDNGTALSEGVI